MRIFRNLRIGALRDRRTRRYLLYAAGEIALVVIGILIALQVDNLNEEQRIRERERKYLVAVRNEFTSNLRSIDVEAAKLARVIEAQQRLVALIDTLPAAVDEDELSELIVRAFARQVQVEYESGVLEELINSGGLREISNDSIKVRLASWDAKLVDLRYQERELLQYRNRCSDMVITAGDFRVVLDRTGAGEHLLGIRPSGGSGSNRSILQEQVFENNLLVYMNVSVVLHRSVYPTLRRNIETLLALIETELG